MTLEAVSVANIGNVMVMTTHGRGRTPEEIAELALNRILHISETAHPLLAEQAYAMQAELKQVLVRYLHEAVKSHNTTLVNKFIAAGHPELVHILES